MNDIYTGALVRLSAINTEEIGKAHARWVRDSEYRRLMESGVSNMASQKVVQRWFEKELEERSPNIHWFSIRKLDDGKLLGYIDLEMVSWSGRDAFVGLGIGDREFWGMGYGTDAMKIILRYAFTEVNLKRVTLNVFEYNPRAIRSYEKTGFRHEGRMRQVLNKEGKRWDLIFMGILREEWMGLDTSRE